MFLTYGLIYHVLLKNELICVLLTNIDLFDISILLKNNEILLVEIIISNFYLKLLFAKRKRAILRFHLALVDNLAL